ncbi:MAG: hypothetical protein HSCHL_0238 [Hydrogenibacillus schlegelii]|uniref:Uncharacterized protein n=1 Tax=Hydrogenibacillus schlegelii TaxID=1484 RepID=A0A2T5G898_HYDSH|nr:MAG: hypothetical protein HSCHL_0238 [Hydrogenibacillus schlegelii]
MGNGAPANPIAGVFSLFEPFRRLSPEEVVRSEAKAERPLPFEA